MGTAQAPTRKSPRLHGGDGAPRPTGGPNSGRIPLHQPNIITQAAIDRLTDDVYYGANSACWTPNKYLQFDPVNTGTDIDIEHFCTPVVHPETGETITSYRKLAKDAVTKETWTTGFGKEFGNLAQGDDKTGTPGLDAIRVMTLEEIKKIPPDRVVTYARVVVDFR